MALYTFSRLSAILLFGVSSLYASTAPYTLQGCYKELNGARLLSAKSTSQTGMTLEQCASYCTGYKYFGVEYGRECYCDDAIPGAQSAPASECNFKCSGNAAEICGGSNRISIYKDTSTAPASVAGTCSVSASNADVAYVGDAYLDTAQSSIVLTNPVQYSVGGIWSNKQVKVTDSFSATFSFKLTHDPTNTAPGCRTPSSPTSTADGIAFVISPNKNTTIGHGAKHIGYDFKNNFAVEFDSYLNPDYADSNQFHIGVQSCGTAVNSADHNSACKRANIVNVANQCFDNVVHTAVVAYNAATKTTTVTLDSVLYQTVVYDLAANLDLQKGDRAYIGFVGSTGGQFSRQEITSFSFDCQVPPPPATCTLNPALAADVNKVNIVRDAFRDANTPSYVITPQKNSKVGAVWIKNAFQVTRPFQVDFTFNLTHQPNTYKGCKSWGPKQTADGIAFVISGSTNNAVGSGAQSLGYNTLPNTLAVEFDIYQNTDYSDPAFAHIGVQSCGTSNNSPKHQKCGIVPPVAFPDPCFDNVIHSASVIYDGVSYFRVYMDSVLVQTFTYNLATNLNLIGGNKAYIGFTGSTGGAYSRQEINFVSYPCA